MHHAYNVDGTSVWALPPYNRAPYFWGSAIGLTVMGLEEIPGIIPADFPNHDTVIIWKF